MDYERVRYDRLCKVVKTALERTITALLNAEQVQKCYPTISAMEGGPEALDTARKQIQRYFHSTCTKQFEHIFEERDMKRKLDELDEIIQSAQRRRTLGTEPPVQVDQLSAGEVFAANVALARQDTVKKLTMIYEQLVVDNKQMYEELRGIASESEQLRTDLVALVEALSSGIDEMKREAFEEKMGALTREVLDG